MATTGISALGKTLIGVEALAGATTDAPTTHWRGTAKLADRRETVFPPERVGIFGGTTRSYVPRTGGEVVLDGDATFEQLCYIMNAGIYLATATTDASSGFTRSWRVQQSSSDAYVTTDLGTMVIEVGDNIDVESQRFGFVREYSLSGKQGEAIQVNATVQGRAPSTSSAFTAVGSTDLENPAQTILVSMGRLYIDDSTGTIGTTAKTETILDFSFKHTTGWVAMDAKDGRLDFSDIKHVDDEMILDVTFEHNGTAIAERAAWRAQTERAIRLQFAGNALTTTDAGATFDTYALRLDLYGKWMTFGADGLDEQDGDNIYKGSFKVAYSAAAAAKATISICNESGTLP